MIFDINNAHDTSLLKRATEGQIVGITSGCWDLTHTLHVIYLQRCSRNCDVLIVGVDSDDLIQSTKGPERPIVPEHQRLYMVSNLSCVGAAFVMGSVKDFGRAVRTLGIQFIFKNQAFTGLTVEGAESAKVVIIPDISQHDSTTGIIDRIITAKRDGKVVDRQT